MKIESLAKAISNSLEIPFEISLLLAKRGYDSEDKILDLYLKDQELSNPFLIPGMKNAALRIVQAVQQDEKIIIYGDYDVDGMLASVILYSYLKKNKTNVDIYIPDRKENGYGMTKDQLEKIKYEKEADLVISVDNGISAFDALSFAKSINLDVIVTDHHEVISGQLPEAVAIVNPKLITKDSDLKFLCGAGIAFYLVRALNSIMFAKGKKPQLTDYLVLSSLATISDMVPMVGDNRILVDKGLEFLYQTEILGLNFLLNKIFIPHYPNAQDLGFSLIPILNAAARMGETGKTINALTEKNLIVEKTVNDLIKLNNERKKLTVESTAEAIRIIEKEKLFEKEIIIIKSNKFHIGLIGLIANKLAEKYKKVVIVINDSNDLEWKASARTYQNLDLTNIIKINDKYLLKGGGHKAAIGMSINPKCFDDFCANTLINYDKLIPENSDIKTDSSEVDIPVAQIDQQFLKHLFLLEPFGINNPAPIMTISGIKKYQSTDLTGTKTIRFKLNNYIEVTYFKPSEDQLKLYQEEIIQKEKSFSIIGELMSTGDKLIVHAKKIILHH